MIFALKLAEIYQQLQVTAGGHRLFGIGGTGTRPGDPGLKTDEGRNAPTDLVNRYAVETPGDRKLILETLGSIATEAVRPFLEKSWTVESDRAATGGGSLRGVILQDAILEQKRWRPSPYQQILLR